MLRWRLNIQWYYLLYCAVKGKRIFKHFNKKSRLGSLMIWQDSRPIILVKKPLFVCFFFTVGNKRHPPLISARPKIKQMGQKHPWSLCVGDEPLTLTSPSGICQKSHHYFCDRITSKQKSLPAGLCSPKSLPKASLLKVNLSCNKQLFLSFSSVVWSIEIKQPQHRKTSITTFYSQTLHHISCFVKKLGAHFLLFGKVFL